MGVGVKLPDRTFDLVLALWYNVSNGYEFLTRSHLGVIGLDTQKRTARIRSLFHAPGDVRSQRDCQ